MGRRDPLHNDHRAPMNRQVLLAFAVLLLAAGGVGLLLLPDQGDPVGPTNAGDRTGAQGDGEGGALDLPPEVLAALQGLQPAPPATDVALPFDPAIAALGGTPQPGEAASNPGPGGSPVATGPGAGAAERAEDFVVDAAELQRREDWLQQQNRRDDLRAEVLIDELGVAPSVAAEARALMAEALAAKTTLYQEQGDAGAAVLGPQLAEIRRLLAEQLTAVLGAQTFQSYKQLDEAGHFVLPDEVKKPETE